MSPRKSLLLLAFLVAVLVSISAYLYVAWEPVNPLRFRVLAITPVAVAPGTPGAAPFEMEFDIVNLCSVPVTLHTTILGWDASHSTIFPPELVIPANSSVRLKRPIPEWFKGSLERWGINVQYTTTSTIRRRVIGVQMWLHARLPASLSAHLPAMIYPRTYQTDLKYAPSPPAPASTPR